MRPRIFFALFILILLGSSVAGAVYEWRGYLAPGGEVVVNGVLFAVDVDKATNETAIIVQKDGETLGVFYVNDTASFNVSGLQAQALLWKGEIILTVSSDDFLQVSRPGSSAWDTLIQDLRGTIQELQDRLSNKTQEIQALKDQVEKLREENQELREKLRKAQAGNSTASQIQDKDKLELLQENRKLKETIANQTQKIMELKAQIKYLQEQNQYLANITKDAYLYAHKVGLEESYQKEKERAKTIDFLWGLGKAVLLVFSGLLIGMGYLYYNWRRV